MSDNTSKTSTHSNELKHKKQLEENKKIVDQVVDQIVLEEDGDDHDKPGLLPPQALLSTPPPPLPPSTEDTSTLLSPWWSEEAASEPTETVDVLEEFSSAQASANDTTTTTTTTTTTSTTTDNTTTTPTSRIPDTENSSQPETSTNNKNAHKDSVVNISILSFNRSSAKESTENKWKERCFLLATTTEKLEHKNHQNDTTKVQNELEDIFDKSKECSMICFLRASQQLTKQHQFTLNPFYGTWISVAKTPSRCKEHLLDASNMSKKSFPDYYTIELGHELEHSGEHVTNAITRTISPLQHLTQKYVDSWKDGSQQAFFSKFWSSMQKGDAFYLVKDSTKRLIENALGHDKKPSDKK